MTITSGPEQPSSRSLDSETDTASGYRRVKGYDIESGEGLVVLHTERNSSTHVTFESWRPRPHKVILRVADIRNNERRPETVMLIPRK